jgi:hypothetical protein
MPAVAGAIEPAAVAALAAGVVAVLVVDVAVVDPGTVTMIGLPAARARR